MWNLSGPDIDQAPTRLRRLFKHLQSRLSTSCPPAVHARACAALFLLGSALIAVAGCGGAEPDLPAADPWLAAAQPDATWLPVLATRDLAVGVTRVAFTLQGGDPDSPPPRVRASLFDLEADRETAVSSQFARFVEFVRPNATAPALTPHGHVGGFSVSDEIPAVGRGVYLVPVRLSRAGEWGIAFEISSADGATRQQVRFRFSVRERPAAPAKGEQARASVSRTLADVDSLDELTSDPTPEPALYQLSLDEALREARPLLLAFATPAFCHSRSCAPVLDVVKAVWRPRASELLAVHVEVFENPHQPELLREAAAFLEWDLPSEPWVFVIDHAGRIYASYEGAVTEAELALDVDDVLARWRAQRE